LSKVRLNGRKNPVCLPDDVISTIIYITRLFASECPEEATARQLPMECVVQNAPVSANNSIMHGLVALFECCSNKEGERNNP
jgi:hypothetical protein